MLSLDVYMYVFTGEKVHECLQACKNPFLYILIGSFSFQWKEFVLFAALLLGVCIIFSIMAYFYEYVDPDKILKLYDESDNDDEDYSETELTKNAMNMEKKQRSTRL